MYFVYTIMHRYIDILSKSDLFTGICTENIGKILEYFDAKVCHFEEGEYIFKSNHELNRIAVFIDGGARIINTDFLGNYTVLSELEKGGIFGEVHSLLPYDTRIRHADGKRDRSQPGCGSLHRR